MVGSGVEVLLNYFSVYGFNVCFNCVSVYGRRVCWYVKGIVVVIEYSLFLISWRVRLEG